LKRRGERQTSTQNTSTSSAVPQPTVLPQHIIALRAEVEKFSKSGEKTQLLHSLEMLEQAMVQYKAQTHNSQRLRRQKAKEKQQRAEARRARHHTELHKLKRETEEAVKVADALNIQNKKLLHELSTAKALYESEKGASAQSALLAEARAQEVEALKATNATLHAKVESLKEQQAASTATIADQDQANKELTSRVDVLEKQLTVTVEQLPQRQNEIIAREEDRLRRWEDRLKDADATLKLSEVDLETRRSKAREEIKLEAHEAQARGLTEVELARRRLNAAVAEFEGDRLKLRESISKVEAEQDAKFRAFSADKLAFESMVKKFKEEKLKFEIEKSMFEPSMRELHATEDSVEAKKGAVEDAKLKLDSLESRVNRELLRLEEKEKDLEMRENQATSKGRALALKEREHDRQGVQLNEQLTNLQAARLQVHEQQLAVQKQVSDVKRAMIALRALEGRVSLGNNHHLVAGGGGGGGVAAAGVLTVTTAEGKPAAGASVSSLSPSKLKAIEALERAITRCSTSLDELSLRSRAALTDITLGAGNAMTSVVGVGVSAPSADEVEGPPQVKPPAPPARKPGKMSARQLLEAHGPLVFGAKASFAVERMKQATLAI